MARVDTVISEYRKRSTRLLDELNELHDVLAVIEGVAATDAARQAFFNDFFNDTPDYDMTLTTFFESVVAWRSLRTLLQTASFYVPINQTRQG